MGAGAVRNVAAPESSLKPKKSPMNQAGNKSKDNWRTIAFPLIACKQLFCRRSFQDRSWLNRSVKTLCDQVAVIISGLSVSNYSFELLEAHLCVTGEYN